MSMKPKKQATLLHALIPIIALVLILSTSIIVFGQDPHIPLIGATIVAVIVGIYMLGFTWNELEEGMIDTIKMAMQATLILMVIGSIIGTWILSGTVPTMIYYGLQILSPGIFLVATALICSIVSLSTGSSWTTAGTVGIALLGIGMGLGMPVGMVAGAIVSGAYFGDKMSPLSDTTNLAPAMAGTNLFDHIRSMLYTTVPALIISLILYGIIGARYAGQALDVSQINEVLGAISGNFFISPLLLIPPILVILIVVMKVPALPGLIIGAVLGGIFAMVFQGAHIGDVIEAAHYGFEMESGVDLVDSLLSRGGLDGMMWTVSLILIALAFGGVMEKTGMLHAVGEAILKFADSTGSLVLATVLTCFAVNLLSGEQYIAIVVPGRMYKDAYKEKGIHPAVLSRSLEGGGTVTSALIPWNTCGAFMMGTLGIHPFVYAPYAFFNLLVPVINVVFGFTGIGVKKLDEAAQVDTAK
ncbi:Na+:H+ antiporter, NhaC family [Natronincola peptidivorans]|uniref:Na+:H+ antiporter, NhaC family n=1 Tax=Natronincola peptidivorans TaxID=426128 RepID=A0A1I0AL29_9FIRM|nr:Na+/H+ antiporter NhaC [Natronincola peptidivorans]SES95002.1 Na+:H+ antiporter, NhaC family [Natronincola peptidivorans]